jgi:RNA polymerase sigma factor (sigma-70 family)
VNEPTSPRVSCVAHPSNESRWFVEEVHAHDAQLKSYIRGSFPTIRDVDDVVQESYLRVWKRQLQRPIVDVTGTVKASVRGFLFRVAKRLALDTLRHQRASPITRISDFSIGSVVDDRRDIAESACTQQEIQLLLQAIESLPPRCRRIVVMRKIQGIPQKEIAKYLGLSEQTVQVQARRGLRRCDDYLRKHGVIRVSSR